MCRMIQVRKSEFQRILQYGDILYNKLQVCVLGLVLATAIDQRSPFRHLLVSSSFDLANEALVLLPLIGGFERDPLVIQALLVIPRVHFSPNFIPLPLCPFPFLLFQLQSRQNDGDRKVMESPA